MPVIDPDREIIEPEFGQHVTGCRTNLSFHNHRTRTQNIDVALVELAKPPAGRAVSAPDRLNLITLEKLRQLVLVLGHHTRQGNGQIITKCQISLASLLVFTALEYLED